MKRRNFLAAAAAGLTAGCSKIGDTMLFGGAADGAAIWHRGLHRLLGGRIDMAPEFELSDLSPYVRGNGSTTIESLEYLQAVASGFADWTLQVGGLVANPLALSMSDILALPQRTQITRHDCVEGWSAIGQWTGPQLSTILTAAQVLPEAGNYIVFYCADNLNGSDYYESCDLDDAFHPQTIVAHMLNGEPLPVRNGAPLRLRLERQLGYKHAKYLVGIEAVSSLDGIYGGEGGYWEDRGYQWYAGI